MKVEEVIRKVRKDFETKNISKDLLVELYQNYSGYSEEETQRFVEKALETFPSGCCGLTSVYLQSVLNEGEVVRGKYRNEPHSFLVLENKEIVDITADQFGGPEIYYGKIVSPWTL